MANSGSGSSRGAESRQERVGNREIWGRIASWPRALLPFYGASAARAAGEAKIPESPWLLRLIAAWAATAAAGPF